ncbi:MAG: PD-(D/E)XK nuclease family protein, partial [Bacillota bacterium]|nr:PD-(D/E)XK nuclease family protein [Bacillota bacterium]
WCQQAEAAGKLEKAREHSQVWKAVLELLDQLVEFMGNEKMSVKLFATLLETGFESMHFALVPPALDQVVVASLDRSRVAQVKCTFILGVNDGILPAKVKDKGMLAEDERELLQQNGVELAPGSRRQLLDEQFLIYNALTRASELLWLSYPLADEEGKGMLPSTLLNHIKLLLPDASNKVVYQEAGERTELEQLEMITNSDRALSYLMGQLRQWQKGYHLAPVWWDVYNWFTTEAKNYGKAKQLLKGLFYANKESNLATATVERIYGRRIKGSVARLERFQACPFAHFASYGLKLRERTIFRLEAPDMGQLYHDVLKLLPEELEKQQKDWEELQLEECHQLAGEVVDQLAPKLSRQILLSSKRHQYLTHRIKRVLGQTAFALSQQAKRSSFKPKALELSFGAGGPLPSINFHLANGYLLELAGRIDRIDVAHSSRGLLVRIIDYKSSETKLDLNQIYFGISLQLLAYLDVVLTYGKKWLGEEPIPAGLLYFYVHNPLLREKPHITSEERAAKLFRSYKMQGMVLEDVEIVKLMDTQLEVNYSPIIPVAIKKSGEFYDNSSVIKLKQLMGLCSYVRSLMVQAGEAITNGIIEIAPYKLQEKTACTYCSFSAVCQFDQTQAENNYRQLTTVDDNTILTRIMEGGAADENE